MKVKTLSMLAGATTLALSSAALADAWGVDYTLSTGEDDAYLAANNLISASFYLYGVPAGHPTTGILGTGTTNWSVSTSSGTFFNTAGGFGYGGNTVFSAAAVAGIFDGDGSQGMLWDSGFTTPSGWGLYAGGIGGTAFTQNGGGGNEFGGIGTMISGNENGDPAAGGDISLFTITWDADAAASVSFEVALAEALGGKGDLVSYSATISLVPAPGALALLGVAGLVGVRRRRA